MVGLKGFEGRYEQSDLRAGGDTWIRAWLTIKEENY